jgi:hypothetical protein
MKEVSGQNPITKDIVENGEAERVRFNLSFT